MALNLEAERDLSLIFERDDVKEAIGCHCAGTHMRDSPLRDCRYCMRLIAVLADAISEWLALVDQDRAARKTLS